MRTKRNLRAPRVVHVLTGALTLALPACAFAIATSANAAQTDPAGLQAQPAHRTVAYGHAEVVTGSAPTAEAGRPVTLQYEPATGSGWRNVDTTTIGRRGRFTLRAWLPRTGLVRAQMAPAASADAEAAAGTAGSGAPSETVAAHVTVDSRLDVSVRTREAVAGHALTVRGRLLPGTAGRTIRLLGRLDGGWRVLARSRTGSAGGFRLRYTVAQAGTSRLRVTFAGDRVNGGDDADAGQLVGLRYSVASWYYDAGDTACGFHAYYGVANKTLPCGTRVAFVYGGRRVTATVDDRGPFVAGRDWDLNQNTADALGMHGVATVLSSS